MNCNVPTDIVFSFTGFAHARRPHRYPPRRLGHRLLRGRRRTPFRRPPGRHRLADRRTDQALPDQVQERHRPHPQGHARPGRAGELPSLRARTVGPLLGVRPQRRPEGLRADPDGAFRPVGNTDSEQAFCFLLQQLRARFGDQRPPCRPCARRSASWCGDRRPRHLQHDAVVRHGELFAHCSTKLCYVVRQYPFDKACLSDEDLSVDFSQVTTPNDRVAIIVTRR
jgi:hypothetical protein